MARKILVYVIRNKTCYIYMVSSAISTSVLQTITSWMNTTQISWL